MQLGKGAEGEGVVKSERAPPVPGSPQCASAQNRSAGHRGARCLRLWLVRRWSYWTGWAQSKGCVPVRSHETDKGRSREDRQGLQGCIWERLHHREPGLARKSLPWCLQREQGREACEALGTP